MKAAVSHMLEVSKINILDVQKTYFDMAEIIIDPQIQFQYDHNKTETMKFFEKDYKDMMFIKDEIEKRAVT
jgi:hypothetical protein